MYAIKTAYADDSVMWCCHVVIVVGMCSGGCMWLNDGCEGWWLLVAKVTQQRWLQWMMVVVAKRFVDEGHVMFLENHLLHNTNSCQWYVIGCMWLNLSGDQNCGRMVPHPSFLSQLAMPSQAAMHL